MTGPAPKTRLVAPASVPSQFVAIPKSPLQLVRPTIGPLALQGIADVQFRPKDTEQYVLPEFTLLRLPLPHRTVLDRFLKSHPALQGAVERSQLEQWQAYDVIRQAQLLSDTPTAALYNSLVVALGFLSNKAVGADDAHKALINVIRFNPLHMEDALIHLSFGWSALEVIGLKHHEIQKSLSRLAEASQDGAHFLFERMALAARRLISESANDRPLTAHGGKSPGYTHSQMEKIHRIRLYVKGDLKMDRPEFMAYVLRGRASEQTVSDHRLYLRFKSGVPAPCRRWIESIERRHDELGSMKDEGRILRAELAALSQGHLTNQEWRAVVLWGNKEASQISDNQTYARFKMGLPDSLRKRLEKAERSAMPGITEKQIKIMGRARQVDLAKRTMTSKVWQSYLLYGDQTGGKDPRITVRQYNRFKRTLSKPFRRELEAIESRVIRREISTNEELTHKQDARMNRVRDALKQGQRMSHEEWRAYVLRGDPNSRKPRDTTTFYDFRRSLPRSYRSYLDRAKQQLRIGQK